MVLRYFTKIRGAVFKKVFGYKAIYRKRIVVVHGPSFKELKKKLQSVPQS
jgi:hypothetical protein